MCTLTMGGTEIYCDYVLNLHIYFSPDINMSLDAYLSRHTSEDNASFSEILHESQQKHREKHAWLFAQEQERLKVVECFILFILA